MPIKIIKNKISKGELRQFAHPDDNEMVKIAVDIKQGILALGCVWHSQCRQALIDKNNSSGLDVWGASIYPDASKKEQLEYDSLINIKPALKHKGMIITDEGIKEKIKQAVDNLIE